MLLSKLFLLLSTRTIGIEDLPFYWPVQAMRVTSLSFVSLFLFISIFTLLLIRNNKVLDLLQGNVKPKKQPKASVLLSLIGVVLLIIGFYALRIELSPSAIISAAIAGITGTYLFYSQLSVVFIRLLKRSRRSTWRGTRLLWTSEMSYKLRDNSRMLFMITVVTALASMGAGYVLSIIQAGREEYNGKPLPSPKRITGPHRQIRTGAKFTRSLRQRVWSTRRREPTCSLPRSRMRGRENGLYLIGLAQYNELAPLAGLPVVTRLGSNEVVLLASPEVEKNDYIRDQMVTLAEQPAVSLYVKESVTTESIGFISSFAPVLIVPEKWMEVVRVARSAEEGKEVRPYISYHYKVPAWDTGSLPSIDSQENIVGTELRQWNTGMEGESDEVFDLTSRAANYWLLKQSTAMLSFVSVFVALIFRLHRPVFILQAA